MLGTFDLPTIGRFVASGDTPEDFLWDLFDQIVLGANVVVPLGGATVTVPGKPVELDAGERLAARGTEEWCRAHSDYFVRQIASGSLLFSVDLPPASFFQLHCIALLGAVMNEEPFAGDRLRQQNILGYRLGFGTPEWLAALRALPTHDFQADELTPLTLINYMLRQGVLTLNEAAGPAVPGVLSMAEARATMAARKARSEALKEEMMREARESRERQRQRKPRRATRL